MLLSPQEISKDFDRNYNDLVGSFKEQLQAQYPINVTVHTCNGMICSHVHAVKMESLSLPINTPLVLLKPIAWQS